MLYDFHKPPLVYDGQQIRIYVQNKYTIYNYVFFTVIDCILYIYIYKNYTQ